MKLEGVVSGYAFTRNPVWVCDVRGDGFLDPGERGRFVITRMGARIFESVVTSPVRINVSDMLEAYSEPVGDGNPDGSGLRLLEDGHTLADRRFEFWIEDQEGDRSDPVGCVAIPGGLSTRNFRKLASLGTDIFLSRFFREKGNFFLTTRTTSWLLPVRESELAPLGFIQHAAGDITIKECHQGSEIHFPDVAEGIWGLDIEELRLRFALEHNILPSVLDVWRDGVFSCRIVVVTSESVKDHCRVRFRNSFGMLEVVDLAGAVEVSLSVADDDDGETTSRRHDPLTDRFEKFRVRRASGRAYEIPDSVVSPRVLDSIADMLGSEEVWLLDVAPDPVKVIPCCESFRHETRPDTPLSMTFRFEECDESESFMADMAGVDDSVKPRLFSSQFVKQFN